MGADLLACWHPDGRAGPRDLRVVLPSGVADAAAALAEDGVLVVRVGRWGRSRALRNLRAAGLAVRDDVLLVPAWPDADHAIALGAPLGDAASRHLGMGPGPARLLGALTGRRLGRVLLAPLLPQRAVVAGRPGGAPPLRSMGAGTDGGIAASRSHRRDATTATVLHVPPGGRGPDRVVKVGLDPGGVDRVRRERSGIEHVAPGLAATGIAVPRLLAADDERGSIAVTPLPGTPLSGLLRRRGDAARGDACIDRLVAAVASWNRAAAAPVALTGARAAAWVLDPADVVAGALAADPDVEALRDALRRAIADHEAGSVPAVAAHGDLTTWNVLVTGDGSVGVVDWESAATEGLPGADLWYLLVDAEATRRGGAHAEAAVALAEGRLRHADDADRAGEPVGSSPGLAAVAFHACWLRHAADEVERGSPGPFLDVVRALAARRLRWPG